MESSLPKKPLYITFLDIEKAYDKAWLNTILYILWQKGIRGKILRLIRKLNPNMSAQVKT